MNRSTRHSYSINNTRGLLRHTASRHVWTWLPLLEIQFLRLPAPKGWWWPDHFTHHRKRKKMGRKLHRCIPLTWTFRNRNIIMFVYFYDDKKGGLVNFSKKKVIFFPYAAGAGCNLHVHILPPPPYVDKTTTRCRLLADFANKRTVERSLIFSVSIRRLLRI